MCLFDGTTLLAIDDLGHRPLPADAASALFQSVSQRYLKTSIVITTSRGNAWGDILSDTTVGAAMLHRLLHRSVVSTSTASPTAYATTTPPQTPAAQPPPAPANRYTDPAIRWGISASTPREFR